MVDDNKIIYEAEVYVSNNKTVAQTASELGTTKKTLQLHFKRLEIIDKNLYDLVESKKARKVQEGRISGGQNGKATSHYTKEDAEHIAQLMISQSLTYREAEGRLKIPRSTIHEILHKGFLSDDLLKKLDILADDNQHSSSSYEESSSFGKK